MKRLKICVIDLVSKAPTRRMWGRIMNTSLAGIMPQAVAQWCEEAGHAVTFICYTGYDFETLIEEIPEELDLAIIGSFTQAALVAYALSSLMRSRGAVTVLGGPHARCYPDDARKYFDYVLGFTDQSLLQDILRDRSPYRPLGTVLSAPSQPSHIPGVRHRWKFVEKTLERSSFIRFVPMIGSLGCPYQCSFCIDSTVPYQQLDLGVIQEDLRFLRSRFKKPTVGWHDPIFGIRFDAIMSAIEDAVPPGSVNFISESTLSMLSEERLKRLRRNGFKGVLPGIESWFDMGSKSRTGRRMGMEKVRLVAEHINLILSYIPYVQVNFVIGLDTDEGPEPFELTRKFIDLAPGAFPAYSLNTAFGAAAPMNLEYQRRNRVVGFPFHFMNNNQVMNVKPLHYEWPEFFRRHIDMTRHSFSWPAIGRRLLAVKSALPRWMNVLRAVSSEGFGRIRYHTHLLEQLETDPVIRKYWEGETVKIPAFYSDWIRRDLGPLWRSLPRGALYHDPRAYLKSREEVSAVG